MPNLPFLLATPTDMLNKARRELLRLREGVTVDTVFNFFVTAYHVRDYLRATHPTLKSDTEALYADNDFLACGAICNQGKHLRVDRKARSAGQALSGRSGLMGVGMIGEMMVGNGEDWDLTYDGTPVDPVALANRVLQKLEGYFAKKSLPIE